MNDGGSMENESVVALSPSPPDSELESDNCTKVPLKEMFEAAVKVIQSLPKDGPYQPSTLTKLRFYSLYKQGTEGKCTSPQPSFFNMVNRSKWEAWNRLGDLGQEDAMLQYIDELKKIVETMSFNGDVQDFLEAINPFYDFVSLQGNDMTHVKESLAQWTSFSSSSGTSSEASARTTPNNASPKMRSLGLNGTHVVVNGHSRAVDKESLEEPKAMANGHLPALTMKSLASHMHMSTFQPPGAPVHRRSIPSGIPGHFAQHMQAIVEGENGAADEVLKVDVHVTRETDRGGEVEELSNATLHARFSAENLHSGTESEKYYSGDSEPELESPSSPSTSSHTILMKDSPFSTVQNVESLLCHAVSQSSSRIRSPLPFPRVMPTSATSSSKAHVDLILHNTVERLNRDVDHILARVRLLETAYATNEQFDGPLLHRRKRRSVFGISPSALTLIITWPFLAYFIIKLVKLWIGRRRR